jgi:thymidylate kinase
MTIPRLLVALEGPCCAGKTTLGRALLAELRDCEAALVACYADYAGGGRFLPRQEAGTVQEREEALRRLLDIEAARMAAVPGSCELLIADRSVHTLLAHSYAMEAAQGTGFFAPSVRLLGHAPAAAWPELILYLDLPQTHLSARNTGKFPSDSIYIDTAFNQSVREYFLRLAERKPLRVAWLDATLDPAALTQQASGQIRHVMARRNGRGLSHAADAAITTGDFL